LDSLARPRLLLHFMLAWQQQLLLLLLLDPLGVLWPLAAHFTDWHLAVSR
jgi:hypothetical protein